MIEQKRKELLQMYQMWETEFKETCSQQRTSDYSFPYYIQIPDGWYDSEYRVMIVGEEGAGCNKRFDMPITEAQKFNKDYLLRQMDKENQCDIDYEWNSSPFWRRIRTIQSLGAAICWNNLDKIHAIRKGRCNLKKKDRIILHSTTTKILAEEIKLLQPTHVIYFGWYGVSLAAELPKVWEQLYPGGEKDYSQWDKDKHKVLHIDGIYHIFTYHPGWGQRQKNFRDNKSYEEIVLEEIIKTMRSIPPTNPL